MGGNTGGGNLAEYGAFKLTEYFCSAGLELGRLGANTFSRAATEKIFSKQKGEVRVHHNEFMKFSSRTKIGFLEKCPK